MAGEYITSHNLRLLPVNIITPGNHNFIGGC